MLISSQKGFKRVSSFNMFQPFQPTWDLPWISQLGTYLAHFVTTLDVASNTWSQRPGAPVRREQHQAEPLAKEALEPRAHDTPVQVGPPFTPPLDLHSSKELSAPGIGLPAGTLTSSWHSKRTAGVAVFFNRSFQKTFGLHHPLIPT